MTQQRSPRRFRFIRNAAVALLAVGGTVLAASPAGAATSDGANIGCQVEDTWYSFGRPTGSSRLWVAFPTVTAANATTFVRYSVSDGTQNVLSPWYYSTTGQLLPNPYGAPYASGTREWYNLQTGKKMYFASDTLTYARPGTRVVVAQERVVYQNGRWSTSKIDLVGIGYC